MKYFILIFFITFIIFSNFTYATDPSILCDTSFLTSSTPGDIATTLRNIRNNEDNRPRGFTNFIRSLAFDRDAQIISALRQTCDETTGDTPMHLAARLGADFDVIDSLIQQEVHYTPHLHLNNPITRTNKLDQTPVDILKEGLIENLPDEQAINLDTLLELYIMQQQAIKHPLRRTNSITQSINS